MTRYLRPAILALPLLLLAGPVLASSVPATQQGAETGPGTPRLPLEAYKMPNQEVDVPVIDVYRNAGGGDATRMRAGCEGRFRIEALPNAGQFNELTKKLNLPSKAECMAFARRQSASNKTSASVVREATVNVPQAPASVVSRGIDSPVSVPAPVPSNESGFVRMDTPAAPATPSAGAFTPDEYAPLPLNP